MCTEVHISHLFIYPIKSCGGISIQESQITETGLQYDREFVLCEIRDENTDQEGYKMLTIRNTPRMAMIRTRIVDGQLYVSLDASGAPDHAREICIPLSTGNTARDGDDDERTIEFKLHKETVVGVDLGDRFSRFFSEWLGRKVRLIRKIAGSRQLCPSSESRTLEVAFSDQYPLLVTTMASIKDVNTRVMAEGEAPLEVSRFRPNIILDGDLPPFIEDSWQRISLGQSGIEIDLAAQCIRCLLPNVDPETGLKSASNQPYRVLNRYRKEGLKPVFGMHASFLQVQGALSVGDTASCQKIMTQ